MSKLEATNNCKRSKSVMKIAEGKQEGRTLPKQLQQQGQKQQIRLECQREQKYLNPIDSSRIGPKQASDPAKKPNESDESSVVFCSPMNSESCESPHNQSFDYYYRNNNNTNNNNPQHFENKHNNYLQGEDQEILKASSVMEFNARELRISTSESQCEARVKAALNEWQQLQKNNQDSESVGGKNITQVQKGVEELERQFGVCLNLADKMESKYKSISFLMKGTTVQKVSRTSRKKKWQDRVILYSVQTNSICWRKCSDMYPQKRQGIPLSAIVAVCVTPAQNNSNFPVNKGVVCLADQYLRINAEMPHKDLEIVCKDKDIRDNLVTAINLLLQEMKESKQHGEGQIVMVNKENRAVSMENKNHESDQDNSITSAVILAQKKYFQAEINALMGQLEDTKGIFKDEISKIQAAVREGATQFIKQERTKERAKRYEITAKAQQIIANVMQDLQQKQQGQSGIIGQSEAISTSNNITVNEGGVQTKNYHWIKQQQLTEESEQLQQQQYRQQREQEYQQQQLYQQIYLEQGQLDECDISSENNNNNIGCSTQWKEQQQLQQQQLIRQLRECISKLSVFPCCQGLKDLQKQQSTAFMQQQDVLEMVEYINQGIEQLSIWSNQQQCGVRQLETRHTQLLREYNELLEEKRLREEKIQAEMHSHSEEIAHSKRINEELKMKLTEFQQRLNKKQEEFKDSIEKLTEMKDSLVGQIASLQGQNNQLQLTINTNSQSHMLKVSYLTKQLGEKEEKIKELEKNWKLEKEVEINKKIKNCIGNTNNKQYNEDVYSGINKLKQEEEEDEDESETQRTYHTRYTSQTQTTNSNNKQQYSQMKVKSSDQKDKPSSVGMVSAHLTPKRIGSPLNSPHRNILENTYHNSYITNNIHNTSSNNSNQKSIHNQSESSLRSNQKETTSKPSHRHNFSISKNPEIPTNNGVLLRNNFVGEKINKPITLYEDYNASKPINSNKPITKVLSNDSLLKHDSDRVPYVMGSNTKRLTAGSFREACNVSETSKGSFNERFGSDCRVGSNEKERLTSNSSNRKDNHNQFFQDSSSKGRDYLKQQQQQQIGYQNNNELQYSFKAVSPWNVDSSHQKQQQDKENIHPNITPKHTRNQSEKQFGIISGLRDNQPDVMGNHNRSYKSNMNSNQKIEQFNQNQGQDDEERNIKKIKVLAGMDEESNRKLGSPSPQTEVRYPFAATAALRPVSTLGNLRQQQVTNINNNITSNSNNSNSSNNLLKNKSNLGHHRIESYQDFDRRMAKQFSKVVQQK